MLKGILCAAALAAALISPAGAAGVSAESAILTDSSTGRVFFEKNADTPRLIASTTKIMTALVALDNSGLSEEVEIPKACELVGGSSMYLREGERLTVEELLYGLLLLSGNDAALALALHCGGEEDFVRLMNEKAAELGLRNTSFANPHGLDAANNYSTARDMAALAAYAMSRPDFRAICSSKSAVAAGRSMSNHNKLLWQLEGACGVKTGFTKAAGRCLVSCVEREGRRLIAVTLNAPDDWRDHALLYEAAFGAIRPRVLTREGEAAARLPVAGGGCAEVVYGGSCEPALTQDEFEGAELRLELPRFVYGFTPGEAAGLARVYINGREYAELPLIYRK